MANLYGVANAPGIPQYLGTIGAANVTCPTGVNQPVWTSTNLIAPSPGYFFCFGLLYCNCAIGASYPNGIFYSIQIGSGSLTTNASASGPFPVSTNIQLSACVVSPASQIAWQGAGSPVTITVQGNTNPITVTFGGSYAVVWLVRAPDQ